MSSPRILQLIDSLATGGAERMAVNYANALLEQTGFAALVASRKEGPLKEQVHSGVAYLFLNKKRTIDLASVLQLRRFIKEHRIEYIHAHSSSYFLAVLIKLVYPGIKIIWHDHYGNSEFLKQRAKAALKPASYLFRGIISVNSKLVVWAKKELHCENIIYLPNFVYFQDNYEQETFLRGVAGKRIVCLANLREQKNHFMLLELAERLRDYDSEWTFHLVGKDFQDEYSQKIKERIAQKKLEQQVFILGAKNDIPAILAQTEIGILTSKSEGLPVALLEYAYCQQAVICTDVGEIGQVIQQFENGVLVSSINTEAFYRALIQVIENNELRNQYKTKLHQHILQNYTPTAVLNKYLNWLK